MSRRLWFVAGLALFAHAAALASERTAGVRLVEVTSESTAASQSVLITATEPASHSTRQPDPVTVLITLRDVAAGDVVSRLRPAPDDPVDVVEVLDAVDDDGTPVAQILIGLREPTIYEVRSRRQTIQVRFARPVVSTSTAAPADAAPASPLVGRSPPATAILSVGTTVEPHALSVTVHGNGALSPVRIYEAEHLPPRLVIEFPRLVSEAAPVTPVAIDPVQRVRVAASRSEPTRVVLDLARPATYHIEHLGGHDRILRVVFPRDRAIDPVAQIGPDPASETAAIREPVAAGPPVIGEGSDPADGLDAETVPRIEAIADRRARPEVPGAAPPTATVTPVDVTAPLAMPAPEDVPPRVWPQVSQLAGAVVALAPSAAPLLMPAPPRVWPQVSQLAGAVVALTPGAAPLLMPTPPRVWPQIPQLAGTVVALAPGAAPLLMPAPPRVWPQVSQLAGAVVALTPGAAPLLMPAPPRVWPQIPQLAGAVVALAPGAAPLLMPAPPRIWPQVSQLAGAVVAVAPGAAPLLMPAPLLHPEPRDLPSPVAASRAIEQFVPLRGSGLGAGARTPRTAIQLPGQPAATQQEYTGELISMDFQNIDLRAVLRVFAEISTLNIVIDPSVQGEVNVALTQVPWDQAFDIILRANGLDYEVDGTVVRIASVQQLQQEAQDRALLSQREAEAGELVLFTRTLSYARAEDLVQLVTSTTLSPRGEVFTDARTNTLIIRDLEDRLTALSALLDTLDRRSRRWRSRHASCKRVTTRPARSVCNGVSRDASRRRSATPCRSRSQTGVESPVAPVVRTARDRPASIPARRRTRTRRRWSIWVRPRPRRPSGSRWGRSTAPSTSTSSSRRSRAKASCRSSPVPGS